MGPMAKDWSSILLTGAISAAVPVTKTSCVFASSSGLMRRSTTVRPFSLAISMTVWRVMPFRKRSASGVWSSPFMTRNKFAPEHSPRLPS